MSGAISIVGSRKFDAPEEYASYVLDRHPADVLISGGALGVDRAAEEEARRRGLHVVSYRPRQSPTGYVVDRYENGEKSNTILLDGAPWVFKTFAEAAKQRNWFIAEDATDGSHALWDGMSGGTAHSIAAGLRCGHKTPKIWMAGDS